MKKINLLGLALVSFVMFSCGSDAPAVEEEVAVEEVVEEVVEEAASSDIPSFESEELTAFATEFDTYMDKALDLMKQGDMEGLQALEEEGKALQEMGENLKDNVSDADKAQLEEYLKSRAMEMLSASGLDQLGDKMQEELTKE